MIIFLAKDSCVCKILYFVILSANRLSVYFSSQYTAELADKADEHGVKLHAFADDTQWYVHCRRDDALSAMIRLQQCIMDIDTGWRRTDLN